MYLKPFDIIPNFLPFFSAFSSNTNNFPLSFRWMTNASDESVFYHKCMECLDTFRQFIFHNGALFKISFEKGEKLLKLKSFSRDLNWRRTSFYHFDGLKKAFKVKSWKENNAWLSQIQKIELKF